MNKPRINKTIPIDENFFCDGHYVVLLSQSLGGSGIDPLQLADTLGAGDAGAMQDLLRRGVCLPICFGTDCALDGATRFVVGNLDDEHRQAWVARLTGKLAVPCGKLVLLCGGGNGDDLARAVSGTPPEEDFCIYQTLDVPPGDYRVDVLAYLSSVTVGLLHQDLDDDELQEKYEHLPAVDEGYVVHLTPLDGDLPLPALVDEVNWPGVFELRE
jgi:hypothetical protein